MTVMRKALWIHKRARTDFMLPRLQNVRMLSDSVHVGTISPGRTERRLHPEYIQKLTLRCNITTDNGISRVGFDNCEKATKRVVQNLVLWGKARILNVSSLT